VSEKKLAFMQSFIGKTIEAITLKTECGAGALAREPQTEALTDNYLKLHLTGDHAPNRWITALVMNVANGALIAVPI
jgi:hypothetical protein